MNKTGHVILITVFIILFLPVLVIAGVVQLPQTGQTTCYDSSGPVIACSGTGQDGDIQAGVAWPVPRFTDNGDSTVTDNLTGLMWTKDGNVPGPVVCSPATWKTWQGALDYVACLNTNSYLGYTDWRLPNVLEIESLINAGQSNTAAWLNTQEFSNVQSGYYWSSTSGAGGPSGAWVVGMWDGSMFYGNKSNGSFFFISSYVWPVRSGLSGVAQLWETGQTTCYDIEGNVSACIGTGQDGDIKAGIAWPSPRFTVGTGTEADCVTDNLTGLMWTKDANLPSGYKMWQQALDYANSLSLCGYTDWRLPDRKELLSLIDFSRNSPALSSGHPFLNVQSDYYWSSTSLAYPQDYAWVANMWNGGMYADGKSFRSFYVWPVRSGQVTTLGHSVIGTVAENSVGLSGVTITLSGDATATTTTASDGTYSFTGLADGDYTITPGLGGYTFTPVNRSITITGADIMAQDFSATCVQNTYYRDSDNDTYGNASVTIQACTQPSGYVTNSTDCNDGSASINPGVVEVCNGVDDNCNGKIDDGVQNAYYQDSDNDIYGNVLVTMLACTQPTGYVADSTDCNDSDASVNPDASEVSNGIDDNCNGEVDDVLLGINNDPPMKPNLAEPANGATGIPTALTLKWEISADADGDPVTYKLYIGTEPGFTDISPIILASASTKNNSAMALRYSMGMIGLFGIITIGGLSANRKKMGLFIVAIIMTTGFLFTSCGSTGGGDGNNKDSAGTSDNKSYESYTLNLQPNTTYYWKVVADDGKGGVIDSDIYSFTTGM